MRRSPQPSKHVARLFSHVADIVALVVGFEPSPGTLRRKIQIAQ